MGLAAFNRMRQLEAMKPENIEKEIKEKEIKVNNTVPAAEAVVPTVEEVTVKEVEEVKEEAPTTRRRRRTTNTTEE